jgi:hypothetical protein
MGLFDSFITFLTEGGKKEGFRLWEGTSGSYIKKEEVVEKAKQYQLLKEKIIKK